MLCPDTVATLSAIDPGDRSFDCVAIDGTAAILFTVSLICPSVPPSLFLKLGEA